MKHTTSAIVLAALLTACSKSAAPPATDPITHRVTSSGPVVGFQGAYGSHVWRGIPYAQPPVGSARWRAPNAPKPWTDTRVALEKGSPCVQYASPLGGVAGPDGSVVGSEDCLYLNVYAPRVAENAVPKGGDRWPVMLWIHGGGNTIGEAGFYDGGRLAATENVVVVTVNYRLGPFGWFRHAALRDGSTTAAEQSGNFATLDLIRALEWVRDNIGAFGGDPNRVTIFGESAGGHNVFTLLLAPAAKGLFHRAIVQSGGLSATTPAEAENFADDTDPGHSNSSNEALLRLIIKDGAASDRQRAKRHLVGMSAASIATYLRGRSPAEIMAVYSALPHNGMIDMPTVIRDGTVLPADDFMTELAGADRYNQVPVMLGTNRDETKLFLFGDPRFVKRYLWIVPRVRDQRAYDVNAEYAAAMWKATGADAPAAAMRAANPAVFVYRFDWDEEPTMLGADLSQLLGASHGFEIPFVFGHFDLGKEGNVIFTSTNAPGREALSRTMMSYWAEFARHGAPGRGGAGTLPEWTAWNPDPTAAKFIVFDTDAGGGTRMATGSRSTASIIEALDADTRLQDPRQKCAVLHDFAQWFHLPKEDYVARQECKAYPFEQFPWDA